MKIDSESEIVNVQMFYHQVEMKYQGYKQLFTDGSKTFSPEESVASGIYLADAKIAKAWKLNNQHSVLAAELYAIYQALHHISINEEYKKVVIFTDSMTSSKILRIKGNHYVNIVDKIQQLIWKLNRKRTVRIAWIKAHCGITGNEIADTIAKCGHKDNKIEMYNLHKEDVLALIKKKFLNYWNECWKNTVQITQTGRHLASIKESLGEWTWTCLSDRRSEVALARLRMGHAGVNAYLARFGLEDSPFCNVCQTEETVEHVLINCAKYQIERVKLRSNLKNIGVYTLTLKGLLGGEEEYYKRKQLVKETGEFLRRIGIINKI